MANSGPAPLGGADAAQPGPPGNGAAAAPRLAEGPVALDRSVMRGRGDTLPRSAEPGRVQHQGAVQSPSAQAVAASAGQTAGDDAKRSLAAQAPAGGLDGARMADHGLAISDSGETLGRESAITRPASGEGPSAPAPSGPQTQAARQVLPQILEAMRSTSERSLELRLQPEELGRVSMSFTQESGGGLSVALAVDRADTLELIRRNIALLGDELRRMGYESVEFSFQDGRQGEGHAAGATAFETGPEPRDTAPDTPAAPDSAAPKLPPRGAATLDIRM